MDTMKNSRLSNLNIILAFILALVLSILLYKNSIDAFIPVHIIPILQITHSGYLSEVYMINNPGFYFLGSFLSLVSGIPPAQLMFLPIQLIPILSITFILFRKLSNSSTIAVLIVLIYSTLNITGVNTFFWIHGMATIVFFSIVFMVIRQLKADRVENIVLILILIISLVYLSYNLTMFTLILFFIIASILILQNRTRDKGKSYFRLFIIILVVQLGLSEFVYKTLIPQLSNNDMSKSLSIEQFIFNYLFPNQFIFRDLVIIYPKIISIISIFKYGILLFFVIITVYISFKFFKNSEKLEICKVILLSFILTAIAYTIARLAVVQFTIGTIFIPGIISICILYRFSSKELFKKIALISLIFIFCANLGTYYIFYTDNLINNDENNFEYLDYSNNWFWNHSDGIFISDVQTKFLYYLYISKIILQKGEKLNGVDYYTDTLDPNFDIYPIIGKNSTIDKTNAYYILNKRMNIIVLNNWIYMKPWRYFEGDINKNTKFEEIYDDGNVNILVNSKKI